MIRCNGQLSGHVVSPSCPVTKPSSLVTWTERDTYGHVAIGICYGRLGLPVRSSGTLPKHSCCLRHTCGFGPRGAQRSCHTDHRTSMPPIPGGFGEARGLVRRCKGCRYLHPHYGREKYVQPLPLRLMTEYFVYLVTIVTLVTRAIAIVIAIASFPVDILMVSEWADC